MLSQKLPLAISSKGSIAAARADENDPGLFSLFFP
jgi:hypothetical protein